MGVAESFQTQPSSHQIRLPRDSEYSEDFLFDIAARQTMELSNVNGAVMTIDLGGTMVGLEAALECQDENG